MALAEQGRAQLRGARIFPSSVCALRHPLPTTRPPEDTLRLCCQDSSHSPSVATQLKRLKIRQNQTFCSSVAATTGHKGSRCSHRTSPPLGDALWVIAALKGPVRPWGLMAAGPGAVRPSPLSTRADITAGRGAPPTSTEAAPESLSPQHHRTRRKLGPRQLSSSSGSHHHRHVPARSLRSALPFLLVPPRRWVTCPHPAQKCGRKDVPHPCCRRAMTPAREPRAAGQGGQRPGSFWSCSRGSQ